MIRIYIKNKMIRIIKIKSLYNNQFKPSISILIYWLFYLGLKLNTFYKFALKLDSTDKFLLINYDSKVYDCYK